MISLSKEQDGWLLRFADGSERLFAAIFLAGVYETRALSQAAHLPLRRSRGQLVYIDKHLVCTQKTDLNFVNYLTEADDSYVLGATFDIDDPDENLRPQDSQKLLNSLLEHFPGILSEPIDPEALAGRVCFRAVVKDYFPIVGPAPDLTYYNQHYGDLKHGRPISKYPPAEYMNDLYFSCGHGSRGFSSAPLAAAYLSRLLRDGIHILPKGQVQALHPARFKVRDLRQQ